MLVESKFLINFLIQAIIRRYSFHDSLHFKTERFMNAMGLTSCVNET